MGETMGKTMAWFKQWGVMVLAAVISLGAQASQMIDGAGYVVNISTSTDKEFYATSLDPSNGMFIAKINKTIGSASIQSSAGLTNIYGGYKGHSSDQLGIGQFAMNLWAYGCTVDPVGLTVSNCIMATNCFFTMKGLPTISGNMGSYQWNMRAVWDANGVGTITLTPQDSAIDSYVQVPRPFGQITFTTTFRDLMLMLY